MTGALKKIDITGRQKSKLGGKWQNGPRTYLGLMTYNFPNLFTITGPGSPSVLTNMMTSIEQHVEWIGACVMYMKNGGYSVVEPDLEAENDWMEHGEK